MKYLYPLVLQAICALASANNKLITPITDCPEYVPEYHPVSCRCQHPENVNGTGVLNWPGESETAELSLDNVTREDNGTLFTCELKLKDGEYSATTNYTLLVAYGPSSDSMDISLSHKVNFTSGGPIFTLTCTASDVYPEPLYSWTDITCDNGNTGSSVCTFTPGPDEEYVEPVCYAERPWQKNGNSSESVVYAATAPFKLQYEAQVASLTMNDTKETFTVNGADRVSLTLVCKAYGQPPPTTLKFTKPGYDENGITTTTTSTTTAKATTNAAATTTTIATTTATTTIIATTTTAATATTTINDNRSKATIVGNWIYESSETLSDIQCHDMGVYNCTADNGVGSPATKSIMLNVRCPPKIVSNATQHLTVGESVTLQLEAYPVPVPDNFTFIHLRQETPYNDSHLPAANFSAACEQQTVKRYLVLCRVGSLLVPEGRFGHYRLIISNSLGSVEVMLMVHDKDQNMSLLYIIFGGLTLFVFVIIIIIIIVVLLKKKRSSYSSDSLRRQPNYFDRVCAGPSQDPTAVTTSQGTVDRGQPLTTAPGGQLGLKSSRPTPQSRAKAFSVC